MIRLGYAHWDQISRAAEQAYPDECCGLLAGVTETGGDVTVTRVVPSPNTAANGGGGGTSERFEVDPQVRFDLMRELNGTGEALVGHYHSHPDRAAKPSEHDLEMAFEPDLVWLITAVIKGSAGKTRAWRLNRETGEIVDVGLEIMDNE